MTKTAVIVPVHNRKTITLNYLSQLQRYKPTDLSLEVVVIDDGSTDGTSLAIVEQYPEVTILHGDGNLWWTGAIKMGVDYALRQGHDTILIMNDDLELDKNFLHELLAAAEKHPHALINSVVLNKNTDDREVIISAGFRIKGWLQEIETVHENDPYTAELPEILKCDLLSGASLLIPTEVFHRIGNFDTERFPHGFADFEYTLRASKAGFPCLVASKSRVYTEQNQNYPDRYLIHSKRWDYLKNLFCKTKTRYGYGFASLYQLSFMHKPPVIGTIYYIRRLLGLARKTAMKLLLPNAWLRKIVNEPNLIDPDHS